MTQEAPEGGAVEGAARVLRDSFDGDVHLPGDAEYDTVRLPWNLRNDPRPAIVAEATGPRDVQAAVRAAREHGLPFAVQATGHGTLVPADGGLLLKTARMAAVEVDAERRTARAATGALWSGVLAAAAPHGLAPVSGSPFVGVTGYTLGGGVGWLSRQYGFAADSLLRAEVVTADGETLVADAERNPDLFWAMRGGSGNFGVATSLEFRLHPVGDVYAGIALYPLQAAPETLAVYREWALEEPDEVNTALTLMQLPDGPPIPEPMRGRRLLAIRVFSTLSAEETEQRLKPLLGAAGQPIVPGFATMDFTQASTVVAGPPPPPLVARQHIDLCEELPDGLLDTLNEAINPDATSPLNAIEVRHWGGAMARPGPGAGPVGHRDVPFTVISTAMYPPSADRERIESYVDGLVTRTAPYATGGTFLNFLGDPARAETAFTAENHARLREVKATWDPGNFFHLNHNIPPA
jgi:FAD binding domain/Berberine and berberine like